MEERKAYAWPTQYTLTYNTINVHAHLIHDLFDYLMLEYALSYEHTYGNNGHKKKSTLSTIKHVNAIAFLKLNRKLSYNSETTRPKISSFVSLKSVNLICTNCSSLANGQ